MSDSAGRRARLGRRLRYGFVFGVTLLVVAGTPARIPVLWSDNAHRTDSPPGPGALGAATPGTGGDQVGNRSAPRVPPHADLGGVRVKGIPAYLVAVDPQAAIQREPALAVRPTCGEQRAFTRAEKSGPVDRVVVVLNHDEPLGLVGTPVDVDWGPSGAVGQLQTLVVDDPP